MRHQEALDELIAHRQFFESTELDQLPAALRSGDTRWAPCLSREGVPLEVLRQALGHSEWRFRVNAASNPGLTAEMIENVFITEPGLRTTLLRRDDVPVSVLLRAITDPKEGVRSAAASHRSLPDEALRTAVRDSSLNVRRLAQLIVERRERGLPDKIEAVTFAKILTTDTANRARLLSESDFLRGIDRADEVEPAFDPTYPPKSLRRKWSGWRLNFGGSLWRQAAGIEDLGGYGHLAVPGADLLLVAEDGFRAIDDEVSEDRLFELEVAFSVYDELQDPYLEMLLGSGLYDLEALSTTAQLFAEVVATRTSVERTSPTQHRALANYRRRSTDVLLGDRDRKSALAALPPLEVQLWTEDHGGPSLDIEQRQQMLYAVQLVLAHRLAVVMACMLPL